MTTNKERMKWINEGVMHERERIIKIGDKMECDVCGSECNNKTLNWETLKKEVEGK